VESRFISGTRKRGPPEDKA